ncbi:hypothetical protein ABNO92_RS25230, partial [Escherichia coli]
ACSSVLILASSRAVCVADGMICTSWNILNGKLPYCANYSLIQGWQTGILPEKKKPVQRKPADGLPSNSWSLP